VRTLRSYLETLPSVAAGNSRFYGVKRAHLIDVCQVMGSV